MIVCGWCGVATADALVCVSCRRSPVLPWEQRGIAPPAADAPHRRLTEAARVLGHDATVERIAEYLDVSPRTVRRWREMSAP